MRPVFWLLAGPNGSGKSTFSRSQIFEALAATPDSDAPLLRLNPDERARRLRDAEHLLTESEIALRAATESDEALDACINQRQSVLVETVLSSDKFRGRVEAAHEKGMEFRLTYVVLRVPDLNVARVGHRVSMGGHGVEESRVRARWMRSVENLVWFAGQADSLSIWDNTRSPDERGPELILATTPTGKFVNRSAGVFSDQEAHPALLRSLTEVIALL